MLWSFIHRLHLAEVTGFIELFISKSTEQIQLMCSEYEWRAHAVFLVLHYANNMYTSTRIPADVLQ